MHSFLRDCKLPVLLLIILNLCMIAWVPILPVDETRYVSVAWEMWTHHNWLVPHLNGLPYSHKPPLLFWLIHSGWKLFGVNAVTPRMIPLVFSILSLGVIHRISHRLWPRDRATSASAVLVLGTTLIWAAWSCAIMFDILLTFWVLLGILGILRASDKAHGGWLLLISGTAGGLLSKGPVVFVYLIPVAMLHPFWSTCSSKTRWYSAAVSALLGGFALALLWAVPAALQGGEEYRNAILWGQTVNRMATSFAHRRPVWWYLPILPALFMPWLLFRPARIQWRIPTDPPTRFCLAWIGPALLIFSLISGKQIHYLLPLIPAGALLIGRQISTQPPAGHPVTARATGCLFLAVGIAALSLPFIHLGADVGTIHRGFTLLPSICFGISGCILIFSKFTSVHSAAQAVGTATVLTMALSIINARNTFAAPFDIAPMARVVKARIDAGDPVVHLGKYHGQYHFAGRLTQPLPVIEHDCAAMEAQVAAHPDTVFISCKKSPDKLPANSHILYTHPYRGKTAFLWQAKPMPDNGTLPPPH